MKKKKRLIWQLYPSYLLVIVISLLAVLWYASISARVFFLKQAESDLEARALFSKNQILKYLQPLDIESIDRICKDVGR